MKARKALNFLNIGSLFLLPCILIIIGAVTAFAQENGFIETCDNPKLPVWEHSPIAYVREGVLQIEANGFLFRLLPRIQADIRFPIQRVILKTEGHTAIPPSFHRVDRSKGLGCARCPHTKNEAGYPSTRLILRSGCRYNIDIFTCHFPLPIEKDILLLKSGDPLTILRDSFS